MPTPACADGDDPVAAQHSPAQDSTTNSAGGPNLWASARTLVGMLLKLGLVLALAYLAALAIKRVSAGRGAGVADSGPVRMLQTLTLGPSRWIHVIAVGERAYLIGSTPQQTTLMAELGDSAPLLQGVAPFPQGATFAARLAQLLVRGRPSAEGQPLAQLRDYLATKIADLRALRAEASRPTGGQA